MTKIEKMRRPMDLRGETNYIKSQLQAFRYPANISVEFLHITNVEEEKLLGEIVEKYAGSFEETELDEAIAFFESPAGGKIRDHLLFNETLKIFDEFIKNKLLERQKLSGTEVDLSNAVLPGKFFVQGPQSIQ